VTFESNTDAVFYKTVKNEEDTVQYCILCTIDREFEFYEFFLFLKFKEFY